MSDTGHLTDETLNEYLDGALPPRALGRADEHLQSCETCTRRLAKIAEVFAALDSLTELPLERDLTPGIVHNLRPRIATRTRPSWRSTWRLGLALAAEVLGAVALLGLVRPEAVSWLGPETMPYSTGAFASALEEAAIFLTAALATPDPLGLQTLLSTVGVPGIPWASISSLLTLLASATLVWLLGNGLLLRTGRLSPHRRDA